MALKMDWNHYFRTNVRQFINAISLLLAFNTVGVWACCSGSYTHV